MTPMSDTERQRQIDDAYRAIGRYFVRFSQLVEYMRFVMARRLSQGQPSPLLAEIATGEHGHANIAAAFFAMCRRTNELDSAEKKVESALRNRFVKINETRTDYAHGDWSVGQHWLDADVIMHPTVVRIRPRPSEPEPVKIKNVPVATIDEQADDILALLEQVSVFGIICLGDSIVLANPPSNDVGPILYHGDLRVRDILKVEKGAVVPGPKWSWLQRPG